MVLRPGNGLRGDMVAWLARILFLLGGSITSIFIAKDALNYPVVSFVMGMLVFVGCIGIIAYEDTIMLWAKGFFSKKL